MTATDDSIPIREHLEREIKNQREYVDLAVKRVADSVLSLEARMGDTTAQHNLSHAREHSLVADAVDKAEKAGTAALSAVKSEFEQYKSTQKDERNRSDETLAQKLARIEASIESLATWKSNMDGRVSGIGSIVVVLSVIAMIISIWSGVR